MSSKGSSKRRKKERESSHSKNKRPRTSSKEKSSSSKTRDSSKSASHSKSSTVSFPVKRLKKLDKKSASAFSKTDKEEDEAPSRKLSLAKDSNHKAKSSKESHSDKASDKGVEKEKTATELSKEKSNKKNERKKKSKSESKTKRNSSEHETEEKPSKTKTLSVVTVNKVVVPAAAVGLVEYNSSEEFDESVGNDKEFYEIKKSTVHEPIFTKLSKSKEQTSDKQLKSTAKSSWDSDDSDFDTKIDSVGENAKEDNESNGDLPSKSKKVKRKKSSKSKEKRSRSPSTSSQKAAADSTYKGNKHSSRKERGKSSSEKSKSKHQRSKRSDSSNNSYSRSRTKSVSSTNRDDQEYSKKEKYESRRKSSSFRERSSSQFTDSYSSFYSDRSRSSYSGHSSRSYSYSDDSYSSRSYSSRSRSYSSRSYSRNRRSRRSHRHRRSHRYTASSSRSRSSYDSHYSRSTSRSYSSMSSRSRSSRSYRNRDSRGTSRAGVSYSSPRKNSSRSQNAQGKRKGRRRRGKRRKNIMLAAKHKHDTHSTISSPKASTSKAEPVKIGIKTKQNLIHRHGIVQSAASAAVRKVTGMPVNDKSVVAFGPHLPSGDKKEPPANASGVKKEPDCASPVDDENDKGRYIGPQVPPEMAKKLGLNSIRRDSSSISEKTKKEEFANIDAREIDKFKELQERARVHAIQNYQTSTVEAKQSTNILTQATAGSLQSGIARIQQQQLQSQLASAVVTPNTLDLAQLAALSQRQNQQALLQQHQQQQQQHLQQQQAAMAASMIQLANANAAQSLGSQVALNSLEQQQQLRLQALNSLEAQANASIASATAAPMANNVNMALLAQLQQNQQQQQQQLIQQQQVASAAALVKQQQQQAQAAILQQHQQALIARQQAIAQAQSVAQQQAAVQKSLVVGAQQASAGVATIDVPASVHAHSAGQQQAAAAAALLAQHQQAIQTKLQLAHNQRQQTLQQQQQQQQQQLPSASAATSLPASLGVSVMRPVVSQMASLAPNNHSTTVETSAAAAANHAILQRLQAVQLLRQQQQQTLSMAAISNATNGDKGPSTPRETITSSPSLIPRDQTGLDVQTSQEMPNPNPTTETNSVSSQSIENATVASNPTPDERVETVINANVKTEPSEVSEVPKSCESVVEEKPVPQPDPTVTNETTVAKSVQEPLQLPTTNNPISVSQHNNMNAIHQQLLGKAFNLPTSNNAIPAASVPNIHQNTAHGTIASIGNGSAAVLAHPRPQILVPSSVSANVQPVQGVPVPQMSGAAAAVQLELQQRALIIAKHQQHQKLQQALLMKRFMRPM